MSLQPTIFVLVPIVTALVTLSQVSSVSSCSPHSQSSPVHAKATSERESGHQVISWQESNRHALPLLRTPAHHQVRQQSEQAQALHSQQQVHYVPRDQDQQPQQQYPDANPDRLVPVFAFHGPPAKKLIQKIEVTPAPQVVQEAPAAAPPTPDVTRETIESDPSLTHRQKAFLLRILDEMRQLENPTL